MSGMCTRWGKKSMACSRSPMTRKILANNLEAPARIDAGSPTSVAPSIGIAREIAGRVFPTGGKGINRCRQVGEPGSETKLRVFNELSGSRKSRLLHFAAILFRPESALMFSRY